VEQHALQTMIDEATLQARVEEMGQEIRARYEGKPLTLIGVLKGSFLFLSDLVRYLDSNVNIEFLAVSSYSGTSSTGAVRMITDLKTDIAGRHCLVVEDIVDTGLTMQYLLRLLSARNPESLAVCTLLDKPSRRKTNVPVDFCGFSIQDRFVVGYGLDLDERYRNLRYIAEVLLDD
jgi:hypoxanthine phosphoribosyltransferase